MRQTAAAKIALSWLKIALDRGRIPEPWPRGGAFGILIRLQHLGVREAGLDFGSSGIHPVGFVQFTQGRDRFADTPWPMEVDSIWVSAPFFRFLEGDLKKASLTPG